MVSIDLEAVARLERAMLNSWPSLSVLHEHDWIVRLADGYTKRANSVTCLGADDSALEQRIERVETIYTDHGLPTIFRLSPLAPPALESMLADRGWRRFDETIVLSANLVDLLQQATSAVSHDVTIAPEPDQAWLEGCDRIDSSTSKHLITLRAMLERLVPPAGFGRINGKDGIDAQALVVVDADCAGIFDVLTTLRRRRQGLARQLLTRLFAWSATKGAKIAWLSVLADNQAAVHLYRSLGFSERYRYHHRCND
ncbi:MAG: GNAT family N-acetyltransferase [Pseudomonadota bacterium]